MAIWSEVARRQSEGAKKGGEGVLLGFFSCVSFHYIVAFWSKITRRQNKSKKENGRAVAGRFFGCVFFHYIARVALLGEKLLDNAGFCGSILRKEEWQVKYAYLFPGQGAQKQGMMRDVCEKYPCAMEALERFGSVATVDMKKLLWDSDDASLSRSDNSQVAVAASAVIVAEVLRSKGIECSAAMGFSLGEFPALWASGVLSFEDFVRVTKERGVIMQRVCEEIAQAGGGEAPGMMAVLGLPPQKVIEIAEGTDGLYAANMNSEKQTVVSGTYAALSKAEETYKAAGARRLVRLAVAGPFHSPLMQKAADEFSKVVENITFNNPKITLLSNVTGAVVTTGEAVKRNICAHIINGVQWTSEERALNQVINDSGEEWQIFETGVGQVLTGLWRQTEFSEAHPCKALNSVETIEGA